MMLNSAHIKKRFLALRSRAKAAKSSQRGMTIVELMVAIVILGLVTAGLTTAVAVGVRQFNESIQTSSSQQMFSSLEMSIDNELRYATNPHISSGTSVDYFDDTTSKWSFIDSSGQIMIQRSVDGETSTDRLVGKAEYVHGLKAKITDLKYDKTTNYFTYTLTIYKGDTGETVVSENVKVLGLNAS